MFNSVLLLAAIALLSLHCSFVANARLDERELDNNLQSNYVMSTKRRLRKYVHIASAPPKSMRAPPGESLQLHCEIYGSPSPTATWLKNGEVFLDYEEEANEVLSIQPSSLARLTATLVVSTPRSGDQYTCLATAGLKQQSASTTLYTDDQEDMVSVEQALHLPARPLITAYYNELFQDMGTNAVLLCRVRSTTASKIYWTDNQNNIIYPGSRFRVLPSGDLMIFNLQWTDMGSYTCTVKNTFGKDSAETFVYPIKV